MRSRGEIELLVATLLSRHGVQAPPVPVREIAISEGLRVIESSISGDVSGALLRSNGMSVIAVNESHHSNRQRFTIGHELAHHFLSHEGEREHLDWQFTVLRRDGKSSEATDAYEIEANFFAASLLMPKDFLRRDVAQLARFNGEAELGEGDIRSLARRYEVSQLAMSYRLVSLGLIDPNAPVELGITP
jgi:Zn-dependent peptidase ImmA (M78 family)